jgi:hypothetical protein
MLCAKGHLMADSAIACPACAAVRAEAALRELQVEFLRKTLNGEFSYALRIAKGIDRHVLMYSSHTRTFCGRDLEHRPKIDYQPYSAEAFGKICAGCRIEIARLVAEEDL